MSLAHRLFSEGDRVSHLSYGMGIVVKDTSNQYAETYLVHFYTGNGTQREVSAPLLYKLPFFANGTSKELTLIRKYTGLGGGGINVGDTVTGWWDTSDNGYGRPINKWKIDCGNGFVGWWIDDHFAYEGKNTYITNQGIVIHAPLPMFPGAVISVVDGHTLKYYSVVQIRGIYLDLAPHCVGAFAVKKVSDYPSEVCV